MAIKSIEGIRAFFSLQGSALNSIRNSAAKIPGKMAKLSEIDDDEIAESICDSIALKVHSTYTGIESILKDVAKEIDGYVPDGDHWHAKLILQMASPIGERQSVISPSTREQLNNLRSFRHFLRTDYGAILDKGRILELGEIASLAIESFANDWQQFQTQCFNEENGTSN